MPSWSKTGELPGSPIPVSRGGTAASTQAGARASLGVDRVGVVNLFDERPHMFLSSNKFSSTVENDGAEKVVTVTGENGLESSVWVYMAVALNDVYEKLLPGHRYTFSFDYRGETASPFLANVSIRRGDSSSPATASIESVGHDGTGWKRLCAALDVLEQKPEFNAHCVYFNLNHRSVAVGDVMRFRDFKLEEGCVATGFFPPLSEAVAPYVPETPAKAYAGNLDWDEMVYDGYYCTNAENWSGNRAPEGTGHTGVLVVRRVNAGRVLQRYYASDGLEMFRVLYDQGDLAWSPWSVGQRTIKQPRR